MDLFGIFMFLLGVYIYIYIRFLVGIQDTMPSLAHPEGIVTKND